MAHPLVQIAANALVETPDGLVLRGPDRLARAVEEWAARADGHEAIAELVHFAVHLGDRWRAIDAARTILDAACDAVPILAARQRADEARRAAAGLDYRLLRRAPMIDRPPVHGTLPAFALQQHRARRRRA